MHNIPQRNIDDGGQVIGKELKHVQISS